MRSLALLLGLLTAAFASADMVGQWQGIATLGPSNIAQSFDGDNLLKLQISKAFLKTLNYQLNFKADHSFTSNVVGEGVKPRQGKGTWSLTGNMVTLAFAEENGAKRSQVLKGSLTPDGKKMVITIDSKPGLPPSKLVFKKFEAAAIKPGAAKSTRH